MKNKVSRLFLEHNPEDTSYELGERSQNEQSSYDF